MQCDVLVDGNHNPVVPLPVGVGASPTTRKSDGVERRRRPPFDLSAYCIDGGGERSRCGRRNAARSVGEIDWPEPEVGGRRLTATGYVLRGARLGCRSRTKAKSCMRSSSMDVQETEVYDARQQRGRRFCVDGVTGSDSTGNIFTSLPDVVRHGSEPAHLDDDDGGGMADSTSTFRSASFSLSSSVDFRLRRLVGGLETLLDEMKDVVTDIRELIVRIELVAESCNDENESEPQATSDRKWNGDNEVQLTNVDEKVGIVDRADETTATDTNNNCDSNAAVDRGVSNEPETDCTSRKKDSRLDAEDIQDDDDVQAVGRPVSGRSCPVREHGRRMFLSTSCLERSTASSETATSRDRKLETLRRRRTQIVYELSTSGSACASDTVSASTRRFGVSGSGGDDDDERNESTSCIGGGGGVVDNRTHADATGTGSCASVDYSGIYERDLDEILESDIGVDDDNDDRRSDFVVRSPDPPSQSASSLSSPVRNPHCDNRPTSPNSVDDSRTAYAYDSTYDEQSSPARRVVTQQLENDKCFFRRLNRFLVNGNWRPQITVIEP